MNSFGLYVHWPFCQSKCPYCDFNSHVRATIDVDRWQRALLAELSYCQQEIPQGSLKSIFFGGGTPSLMPPSLVEAIIKQAFSLWPCASSSIEITLEANPGSVEMSKLQDFKKAGVNRLSLGIQSLRAESLKFLGRLHSQEEAVKALEIASKVFDRFSFDLIYARPQQGFKEWTQELNEALSFAKGHMSLYQLTIEEGTAFYHAHKRGDFQLPPEDKAALFYELTQEIMTDHGMPAYEISNHAIPGQESQHNLGYWHYQPFAAIGPGAHGRFYNRAGQRVAIKRLKAPETWLSSVEEKGHGTDTLDILTREHAFEECLMMGLRLTQGLKKATLQEIDGPRLHRLVTSATFKSLQQHGLMEDHPHHLIATPQGRLCLTALINKCALI